jgi:hypothetical protein
MAPIKNTMEVFKLLNMSNCQECNEKTCLAFAAAVFQGKKQLGECPHLEQELVEKYGGNIEKQKTIAEEQEEIIKALKDQVTQVDFASVAGKIGGTYANGKLTLKVFGKDFSIDSFGTLSSDIHINPWVTAPLLNYILSCDGQDVKGEWVPFRELKNGKTWQGLFGQQCEKPLKKVADTYTELFEDLIHLFNGKQEDNHYDSDISLSLYPLPKIPILICYWKPEDGLASDLNLFFDSTAEMNCSIEGIYALGTGLVRMFEKIALRHGFGHTELGDIP